MYMARNTILISGFYKNIDNKVDYNIIIWAHQEGEALEFITAKNIVTSGYDELWKEAKNTVVKYYDNHYFHDGAYTNYLDHIISIN